MKFCVCDCCVFMWWFSLKVVVPWPLKAGKLATLCRIPACRLMRRTILGHLDFLKNNGWWSEVSGGVTVVSCFCSMKSKRISTPKGYWWIIWPLATEGSNLLYNFETTNWVKSFVFDFQSSMVDVNINELHTEMSSFKLYRLFRGVSQALWRNWSLMKLFFVCKL